MKTRLAAMVVMGCLTGMVCAEGVWQVPSRYYGKIYRSWVTQEAFDGSPSWDPLAGTDAPVTIKVTIEAASAMLGQVVGVDKTGEFVLQGINLAPVTVNGKTRWFYSVAWAPKNKTTNKQSSSSDLDGFILIVDMSGRCVRPVVDLTK